MNVGTKDLKNRLSHYLRQVRAGEPVYVTDRGEVIAEIRPVETARRGDGASLQRLAAKGLVTLGRGRLQDFEPVTPRPGKLASRMVIEDRG